ncbi:MAG: hypothetical protein GKC10_08955, partial [Methanosarcinales archaeon]|nr:hypothetical protein [Methanosarcinales archaeon]
MAGVDAIEVGFSVSDGDDSLSIVDSYEVDDSISVSETGVANAQTPAMSNNRVVQGSGDADMTQVYSSESYSVQNNVYALGSHGLYLRTGATMTPCYFDLSQSLDLSGGQSRYVLSGDYFGEGVLQYAGVTRGVLTSSQSLTFSDGIYSSQNIAARGLNPRAFASAGQFRFDPITGEILGSGGFVGLGVLGMGQISGLLQANTVVGQPSTTAVSGSNLDARTRDLAFVTAGAGDVEGNLNDGQIDVQGAAAVGGVVNGRFTGDISAVNEREVSLPSCAPPAGPLDPRASINLVGRGDLAFEGAAAGDVELDAPRGTLEAQGALVGAGAAKDASVQGSMYAMTDGEYSSAGGTGIRAGGDAMAATGAASGNVRADWSTGTFEGEAALVGAGAAGQNSVVQAGMLDVGTGSAFAYGSDIMARGDEFALAAVGAGNLMFNPKRLRGEGALFGVGAGENGRVDAAFLSAGTMVFWTYTRGEGISARGDD